MPDHVPVPDDTIKSSKQLASVASELTDEEIKWVFEIVMMTRAKYSGRSNSSKNLEAMRDEVLTRLMERNIIAELDPAPALYGEPPVLEIIGKVTGDGYHKYGFDHEKKYYEVNKAVERKEDFLGQKERYNKRKDKK